MNPENDEDVAGIQIDTYGVKAKIVLREGDAAPQTWQEVGRRIKLAVMRIATGVCEVPAEALDGIKRALRGLTSLPGAAALRIAGAHATADKEEAKRQALAQASRKQISAEEAAANLEDVLLQLKSRGHHVELVEQEGGRLVIVVVRPELADQARTIAAEPSALPAPAPLAPGTASNETE